MEINPVVIDLKVESIQPIIDINVNPVPLKGDKGLSAYEVAVAEGFVGTEQEWLLSLKVDSIEWTSTNW